MPHLLFARVISIFLFTLCFTQSVVHAADDTASLNLERYRGKVVIVDFWASWCVPCRQSFPWLNEIQSKYAAEGVVVIGVNVDRERADADRFLKDVPAQFEILFDPEGKLAAAYDIPGMPSTYVFDANGQVISKHIGFRSSMRSERESELKQVLATQTLRVGKNQ